MAKSDLKLKSGVLSVQGIQFYAYHGCLPEETKIGSEYIVDVDVVGDFKTSVQEDELKNTFDYTTIYNLAKKEMDIPSKLIEHVAGRIANAIRNEMSGIKKLTIVVTKINPPVNGNIAQSKIKLEYS
ncbi:MAG: dihydroneopterin aldolase [Bacteroidia bacterium]|nr:dihydroneopterin aldolase [Bacteroidia bacterium]NNC86407.1 dihydroneopterin aldolase [Bacteroidia bacterium]